MLKTHYVRFKNLLVETVNVFFDLQDYFQFWFSDFLHFRKLLNSIFGHKFVSQFIMEDNLQFSRICP